MANHCTAFPEYWYQWYLYKGWIPAWRKVYIGDMCKAHDNEPNEGEDFKGCRNSKFYKDTWNANLVGSLGIATVASVACFIKYPTIQVRKV